TRRDVRHRLPVGERHAWHPRVGRAPVAVVGRAARAASTTHPASQNASFKEEDMTNGSFWVRLYEARMNALFHLRQACSEDPAEREKAEAWLSRWDRGRGGAAWCCQALGLSPPHFIA